MKKIKNRKGITLISLVVTVVILIILAAVAINMTIGNNGLFNKAKLAKEKMTIAQANEDMQLKIMEAQVELSTVNKDTNNAKNIAEKLKEKYDTDINIDIIITYIASVTIKTENNGQTITNPSAVLIEYNNFGFVVAKEGTLVKGLTTDISKTENKTEFESITITQINKAIEEEKTQENANTNTTLGLFKDIVRVGDYVKYEDYTDLSGNLDNSWAVASSKLNYNSGVENYLYIVSNGCPINATAWTANHYYQVSYTKYQKSIADEITPIYGFYGPIVELSQYYRFDYSKFESQNNSWKFTSVEAAENIVKEYDVNYEGVSKGVFLKIKLKDTTEIKSGSGTKADPYILK